MRLRDSCVKGKLKAKKAAGNAFLLDVSTVQLYRIAHKGKGRPLSPEVAWAALWILSRLDPDWLTYQQMRRLRIKLKEISSEDLIWQARKRSKTTSYRISSSFIPGLKQELILTGISSDRDDFGLVPQTSRIEGYAIMDLVGLKKKYHMIEDSTGNAIIHTLCSEFSLDGGFSQMPIAVTAADLALSLDTRERQAGLSILERQLDEYRRD